VVEHLPHHPMVEGLSTVAVSGNLQSIKKNPVVVDANIE
jgi:hypothetical protein